MQPMTIAPTATATGTTTTTAAATMAASTLNIRAETNNISNDGKFWINGDGGIVVGSDNQVINRVSEQHKQINEKISIALYHLGWFN